jgi:hypothetical protein
LRREFGVERPVARQINRPHGEGIGAAGLAPGIQPIVNHGGCEIWWRRRVVTLCLFRSLDGEIEDRCGSFVFEVDKGQPDSGGDRVAVVVRRQRSNDSMILGVLTRGT